MSTRSSSEVVADNVRALLLTRAITMADLERLADILEVEPSDLFERLADALGVDDTPKVQP